MLKYQNKTHNKLLNHMDEKMGHNLQSVYEEDEPIAPDLRVEKCLSSNVLSISIAR